ncbi:MAG TPA: L,D-transpeptidase [Phycisphaerae bacterium]|nr:L,D-transpeptidase [Phycisphaerae bacterium]HQL72883.1 L,D-transpeptidase [Phycisphaerae bacterium]
MLKMLFIVEAMAVAGLGLIFFQQYSRMAGDAPAGAAEVTPPGRPAGTEIRVEGGLGVLREPRVVVEKSARRLAVYDGSKVIKTYAVIVGMNQGDKVREGDKSTPEGEFYVCMKNPTSKFVLSLGLSYPNAEDAARGLRDGLITQAQHDAIQAVLADGGWPDWYTRLGGEIMIHGCAGEREGTAGCVAMQDDDVRELFAAIPLGTPVEIRP